MALMEVDVPHNLQKRFAACLLKGRRPKEVSEINNVFTKIVSTELIDNKKSVKQLATELNYPSTALVRICRLMGIYREVASQTIFCICGCGNSWVYTGQNEPKRKYFKQTCRFRHIKKQIKSGERKPDKLIYCVECGILTPVYDILSSFAGRERETCYASECRDSYRKKRRQRSYELKLKTKKLKSERLGLKVGKPQSAPAEKRSNYCKQILDDSGRKIMCRTYPETCSEGCYRTNKKGSPICFEKPEESNDRRCRPGLSGAGISQAWLRYSL